MTFQEIQALDDRYFMPVFGHRTPVAFVRGEGCTLYDTEGKAYTDFFAGIAVCALGYGHPALSGALHAQVDKLLHTSNVFYNEPQARLLEALHAATGYARMFIANTGAEANEGAIKLARKFFYKRGIKRYGIVSTHRSFHGRTLATVAATGQPKYQAPYRPLPEGFTQVDYGDIDALKAAVNDTTAAILIEPIQGEGGIHVPPAGYLAAVQALCREAGILLICDEVQCGMGRTGAILRSQQENIVPDIVTLAKGLGGGVPIGAFLATQEVADAFEIGDHGTTFGGNPLACAAALAVLGELAKPGFLDRVLENGAYLRAKLEAIAAPCVKEIRGAGLMLGMELLEDVPAAGISRKLLDAGFVVGTAACNTLRFVPPLVIEKPQIDTMIAALGPILQGAKS